MADPLLDDLDASQRAAVTSPAAPLAVLAPAGAGKTRVLTRRIAYRLREGDAAARHVLAVTFTRQAAAELVDRLARLGVEAELTAGTFHALALAQLRRRAAEQGRTAPTVLASKARILAPISGGGRGSHALVADLAAEIEWAKARMLAPHEYSAAARAAGRRSPRPPDQVARAYEEYEATKRTKRLCDFDDLLWWCADAIERDGTFAAAQRWRFRHLFVDEFQDATPLQLRLLRAWLGDRSDLCVVGDVAQSIYGFAGADAGPLARFREHFPGGDVVALTRNYRSTPQIVAVSEVVLEDEAGVARGPVSAARPGGDAPELREYADDDAEAAGVADALWRAFTAGVPWHRMAVLFRTNAQAARFEAACARRGVPFRSPAPDRPTDDPEVRAVLDELRRADRAAPGRPFAHHLTDLVAMPADDGNAGGSDEDTEHNFDDPALDPDVAVARAEARLAAARRVHRLGCEYLAADGGPGTLAGFTAWLDVATRTDLAPRPGVDLLTFHRAKGREWHVVFVTGLERGLVPIARSDEPHLLAEERRLLHVALSRATDALHLSFARTRAVGRRRIAREPSPWVEGLRRRASEVAGAPVDRRDELAALRATLAAASPPAPRRRGRSPEPGRTPGR
jgi:DNA helicase-2/ATP-dependent DNA helicase PcrA